MGHVRQAVTGSLLVFALFLVSCQGTETGNGRPESVPRIGELAPAFALPSAEGGQVSLQDFQGRSPVLLYFSMGPG
jgi:AhpC/TSA family